MRKSQRFTPNKYHTKTVGTHSLRNNTRAVWVTRKKTITLCNSCFIEKREIIKCKKLTGGDNLLLNRETHAQNSFKIA